MSHKTNVEAEGPGGKGSIAEDAGGRDQGPVIKDFKMRIAADGAWYHEGAPIKRKELVRLFSTILKRDEAGDFWLENPVEKGRIEVEDAPFVALELREQGTGRDQVVALRTNIDEWVELDASHPLRLAEDDETGEPRPYIRVKDAPGGGIEARIARAVFYQLVELAEEREEAGEKVIGLWSKGQFFPLGPAAA
jgi:hypothetical protein